jgi:hypothetical protein
LLPRSFVRGIPHLIVEDEGESEDDLVAAASLSDSVTSS